MGKRKDWFLVLGILLTAGILWMGFSLFGKKGGAAAVVTVDGREIGRYSLAQERELEIEGTQGHNRMVIEDGQVRMKEAGCPDQYCVRHAPISQAGDPIVCLPHRIVISVEE